MRASIDASSGLADTARPIAARRRICQSSEEAGALFAASATQITSHMENSSFLGRIFSGRSIVSGSRGVLESQRSRAGPGEGGKPRDGVLRNVNDAERGRRAGVDGY